MSDLYPNKYSENQKNKINNIKIIEVYIQILNLLGSSQQTADYLYGFYIQIKIKINHESKKI